jgi:methylenetetrahydrofolate reductase (NADPH)
VNSIVNNASSPSTNNIGSSPGTVGEIDVSERLARRPWPAIPIRSGIDVSFEFFPPATPAGTEALARCVDRLAPLQPKFVSVTYGAGGTTQDTTHAAVTDLASIPGLPVAGHLTCVNSTTGKVAEVLDKYLSIGVHHIVALRGDAPTGDADGVRGVDGYTTAAELVAAIRRHAEDNDTDIEISVAAYPEVHPKATSAAADMDSLKAKIDAGATRAITQFFFDTDVFLRFLERARSTGIEVPIVPGIMPVSNFAGVTRFAGRCQTSIPDWMHDLFADLDDMPEVQPLVAATVAAEQCRRLAEHGVREFHFYTMNRAELTAATCRILGLRPQSSTSAIGKAS